MPSYNNDSSKSQSIDTNLSAQNATVAHVLEKKGNDIISVKADDTIHDAVKLLNAKGIGAVLVLDDKRHIIGILSERDIVRNMKDCEKNILSQKVEEIMTKDVQTCAEKDPLLSVLKQMTTGRFRHLPVADKKNRAEGIITIGDAINYRLIALEYEALKMKQMIVG